MSHRLYNWDSHRLGTAALRLFIQSLLLGIALTNFSCRNHKSKLLTIVDFKLPVLMDTFDLPSEPQESEWMGHRNYDIYYIGPQMDTLWLESPVEAMHASKHLQLDWDRNKYQMPDSDDVWVKIDHRTTTKQLNDFLNFGTGERGMTANDGHPVFVLNCSTDTLTIGSSGDLPFTMQAKNPSGKWMPIETSFGDCGTGAQDILLPPGYIVMTVAPIFKGDYETKLRLQFGGAIFSEEFPGRISLNQFKKQPFDVE